MHSRGRCVLLEGFQFFFSLVNYLDQLWGELTAGELNLGTLELVLSPRSVTAHRYGDVMGLSRGYL